MKSKQIPIIEGVGSLGPNRTVTVQKADGTSETFSATNVLLASGSVPRTIPGFEPAPTGTQGPVVTSEEVLMLSLIHI